MPSYWGARSVPGGYRHRGHGENNMSIAAIDRVNPPTRLLLGPGPGMPHPRVMNALVAPTLGHLDPVLIGVFEDEQRMLRRVFRTENERSEERRVGKECR